MLVAYSVIAVVQIIGLSTAGNVGQRQPDEIGVIVPWLGTVETNGPTMGSSFLIAMSQYQYTARIGLMPLRCDDHFSVISQVQTLQPIAV